MLLLDCKCATVLFSCSVSSFPRRLSQRTLSSQTKLFYRVKKINLHHSRSSSFFCSTFSTKMLFLFFFLMMLMKCSLEKLFQKIFFCIILNFSFSQITNVLLIFFNYVEYLTEYGYFIQALLFMNHPYWITVIDGYCFICSLPQLSITGKLFMFLIKLILFWNVWSCPQDKSTLSVLSPRS